MRQHSPRYDAQTGEMPVRLPTSVAPVAGPANMLAHYHDENLWDLQIVRVKGRLERRDEGWIFISTAFTPPSPAGFKSRWQMAKAMRRSSSRYLAARGLDRPKVNWTVLKSMQRQAQLDRHLEREPASLRLDQDSRGDPQLPDRIFVEDFRRGTLAVVC